MTMYCRHAICRTDTADDLIVMAERLHRPDLIELARDALRASVRCRLLPRKGPIEAPLATNKRREA